MSRVGFQDLAKSVHDDPNDYGIPAGITNVFCVVAASFLTGVVLWAFGDQTWRYPVRDAGIWITIVALALGCSCFGFVVYDTGEKERYKDWCCGCFVLLWVISSIGCPITGIVLHNLAAENCASFLDDEYDDDDAIYRQNLTGHDDDGHYERCQDWERKSALTWVWVGLVLMAAPCCFQGWIATDHNYREWAD